MERKDLIAGWYLQRSTSETSSMYVLHMPYTPDKLMFAIGGIPEACAEEFAAAVGAQAARIELLEKALRRKFERQYYELHDFVRAKWKDEFEYADWAMSVIGEEE